jgi:2-methylisocitrate lyase-like PEP mutase family enzyme
MKTAAATLRDIIARPTATMVPLVLDPLSAKIAESAGFEAMYLGGGTLGYVKTGTEANLSVTQMAQTGLEIRAASPLPLILDGQCGWGDAMHMRNTILTTEAAGFAGIEIEDQLMPKRAHHHLGIEHLIPTEHMIEKIKVAVAARRDPDFVIIGRTNACRSEGVEEALRRAEAFRKAGADVLLLLQKTPEEARFIGERLEGPLLYMMTGGTPSMGMTMEEFGKLGFKIVLDALTPFYARQRALQNCYQALARGEIDPLVGRDFPAITDEVHQLIDLDAMIDIEKRTVER